MSRPGIRFTHTLLTHKCIFANAFLYLPAIFESGANVDRDHYHYLLTKCIYKFLLHCSYFSELLIKSRIVTI